MSVTRAPFGTTADGRPVELFTCINRNGLELELHSLGATIKALAVPDREGQFTNVALGFPTLDGYLQRHPYFGSTVGRVVNRIAEARFTLDDVVYRLAANDGPNHLHGGGAGFDRVLWQAEPFETGDEAGVRFAYLSRDGDERYPGNLAVEATYSLTDDNELKMSFEASTDAPTPVNLANHTYWNLAGGGTILEHEVSIEAGHYLPVDEGDIPTGEIAALAGTPMDFSEPKPVGKDIETLPGARAGYDHCYVLQHRTGMAPAARVYDRSTGRLMEVMTTQPGLQFYTGNHLTGFEPHGGFGRHAGLCLETQHFPDSVNQPQFPSITLAPGEQYAQQTTHRFSIEN